MCIIRWTVTTNKITYVHLLEYCQIKHCCYIQYLKAIPIAYGRYSLDNDDIACDNPQHVLDINL